MAKKATPKAKSDNKPEKVSSKKIVRYGVHIGHLIDKYIKLDPDRTRKNIAPELKMGEVGFGKKLNLPYYGNVYDLIAISNVMGINFLNLISLELKGKLYYNSEIDELKSDIMKLKEDNAFYKKIIKNQID